MKHSNCRGFVLRLYLLQWVGFWGLFLSWNHLYTVVRPGRRFHSIVCLLNSNFILWNSEILVFCCKIIVISVSWFWVFFTSWHFQCNVVRPASHYNLFIPLSNWNFILWNSEIVLVLFSDYSSLNELQFWFFFFFWPWNGECNVYCKTCKPLTIYCFLFKLEFHAVVILVAAVRQSTMTSRSDSMLT